VVLLAGGGFVVGSPPNLKTCIMAYKEDGSKMTFEEALTNLINKYSEENGSNTPDFILAKYMYECLENFNSAVSAREKWYGRDAKTYIDNLMPTDNS